MVQVVKKEVLNFIWQDAYVYSFYYLSEFNSLFHKYYQFQQYKSIQYFQFIYLSILP
jgi:hypothetical protein